ncbi:MAG: acyl-CoA/acyl-ACP dehydrogenase [Candidatus Dormibacteraeota bacterium]|nr:acyl-CoA/acyl-ACP dehydrogenase [Candidatus Dormibacteraeota bacterium]
MATVQGYVDALEEVAQEVIEPDIALVDSGRFPRRAVDSLGSAGLLGLVTSRDHGGAGLGLREAAVAVERVARGCASTALVLTMHYCGSAVIEAHGPPEVRRQIGAGRHLSTLAFSEFGSRSHFWVPLSTAMAADGDSGDVRLDARKSWVTSAGEADSYVWSSRPLAAEGLSTLWLLPKATDGLEVTGSFDGLGLRGNGSRPMTATRLRLPAAAILGPDGGGFDVMMRTVLPWFQVLVSAASVGIMEAATAKTGAYAAATRLEHLDQTLADQPVTRAHVARMRIATDQAQTLVGDTVTAIEEGRADAQLRVLEVKAAAAESSLMVTELAMRVCGGSAFRREVGVERQFRDARAATVMAPTTDVLYDFIGKAACGMSLF